MKNQDTANDKLIILYVLSKFSTPLSQIQLMKIILENRFMNYFTYQQTLNELQTNSLIIVTEKEDIPFYEITSSGKSSLAFFQDRIPLAVENFINNNIKDLKSQIKTDALVQAKVLEEDGQFKVLCSINEDNFSLIHLQLTVGTRSDAQRLSNNWKEFSQPIYAEIIQTLTKSR